MSRIALTASEAAEALGVSERVIDELEAEGRLVRIDFGKRRIRRYSIDTLREFARGTLEEAQDETPSGRPQALPAPGRAVVRRGPGRPRKQGAPKPALPVRLLASGGGGEAG